MTFAQTSPVIVRIIEPEKKSDLAGLADVLFGSLGLTGILTLGAIVMGLAMAALVFWLRSRGEPLSSTGFLAKAKEEPGTRNPEP